MAKKRVTHEFIARKIGVSRATVSYVLNNRKDKRISDTVRKKILSAARKYNYFPHTLASSLIKGKTDIIGVIYTESLNTFSNDPFNLEVLEGIDKAITENNYIMLFAGGTIDNENIVDKFVFGRIADGLILLGVTPKHIKDKVKKAGIPYVMVDYHIDDEDAYVMSDNHDCVHEAVAYLHTKYKGHFLTVTKDNHPSFKFRTEAFLEACRKHDIDCSVVSVDKPLFEYGRKYFVETFKKLKKKPRVIFVQSDVPAFDVLESLASLAISIPDEIAVMGYDDNSWSQFYRPLLSTVAVDKGKLGKAAVDLLLANISGGKQKCIIVPNKLVIRDSA
jgi:DNA-binding LacI/PurR family transcriptional regulator